MTTTITTTTSNLDADGAHVDRGGRGPSHDAVAEYLAATASRPQPQQLTVEPRSVKR